MKTLQIACFLLGVLGVTCRADDAYRFLLAGKETRPDVVAVRGEKGKPAPGDMIYIGGFLYVLGAPGTYDFRVDGDSKLLCKLPGSDQEACVGVKVENPDDTSKELNPLCGMSKQEKTLLGSVILKCRPWNWDEALKEIPWENVMLQVSEDSAYAGKKAALPQLPPGVRYLFLELNSSQSLKDFRSPGKFKDLEALGLSIFDSFDLRSLARAHELKWFFRGPGDWTHPEVMRGWTKMRSISLAGNRCLHDISFVTAMPELRQLDISSSPATDIRAINGLHKLTDLNINQTEVKKFPDNPDLPELRKLSLLSTKLAEQEIARVRAALPKCLILDSWQGALITSAEGSDRLRVRSGGTCHRNMDEEKTIFELHGVEEVRKIAAIMKIDDQQSGGECMCCGNPTFEFYQGDKLIAMLGFHHGQNLRWRDGDWPGDASLAPEAAEMICRMLADHGEKESLEEWESAQRWKKAWKRYTVACLKLLTEEQLDRWSHAKSILESNDPRADVKKTWPDPFKRATRLLALYGVIPTSPWTREVGLDSTLRQYLLKLVTVDQMKRLAASPDCTEQILQGIARMSFGDHMDANPAKNFPDDILKRLASWGLGHPREENRRFTELSLAELNQPRADEILLGQLRNPAPIRELTQEDSDEAEQTTVAQQWKYQVPEHVTDRGLVAYLLGERAVAAALPEIEKIANEGSNEDRAACALAIEKLRAASARKPEP